MNDLQKLLDGELEYWMLRVLTVYQVPHGVGFLLGLFVITTELGAHSSDVQSVFSRECIRPTASLQSLDRYVMVEFDYCSPSAPTQSDIAKALKKERATQTFCAIEKKKKLAKVHYSNQIYDQRKRILDYIGQGVRSIQNVESVEDVA